MSLRNNNDDILKEWFCFREKNISSLASPKDNEHIIHFDEIQEEMLNCVHKDNVKFVKGKLNLLNDDFLDYIDYWNEKFYRNGFCDGMEISANCFNK